MLSSSNNFIRLKFRESSLLENIEPRMRQTFYDSPWNSHIRRLCVYKKFANHGEEKNGKIHGD